MDPESISLSSTSKLFEYEKLSREIDKSGDMEQLKTMLRCYIKLYLKQQETISVIPVLFNLNLSYRLAAPKVKVSVFC